MSEAPRTLPASTSSPSPSPSTPSSTSMPKPKTGETRDCLDPWKIALIRADGEVALCGWSPSLGNLNERPVAELLRSERAEAMRRGLLTGRLVEACQVCPARKPVAVAALRGEVERLADAGRNELLELRGRNYELQEDLLLAREHLAGSEQARAALVEHVGNLEEQREHLRLHNTNLLDTVNEVLEGRGSFVKLVMRWTRGRFRRSAIGRWWITR